MILHPEGEQFETKGRLRVLERSGESGQEEELSLEEESPSLEAASLLEV
jgi:hypothetical protein